MIDVDIGQRGIKMHLIVKRICSGSCDILDNVDHVFVEVDIILLILACARLAGNDELA